MNSPSRAHITATNVSLCLLFWALLSVGSLLAQDTVTNNAFKAGEHLEYRVYYHSSLGNLTAGEAIIDVKAHDGSPSGSNEPSYHIVGLGNSKGLFDLFFKVRDRFESYVNAQSLLPDYFVRRTREGKFKYDDEVNFDRNSGRAISRRAVKPITTDTHDLISALFFMRTLDVSDFDADSNFYLNFYLDDSLYRSVIKFKGRVYVSTKWGTLPCLEISPMMATGEVFSDKYPMTVWVTDDDNHLPVFAESAVIVGSVQMELKAFDHLKNPLIQPVDRRK